MVAMVMVVMVVMMMVVVSCLVPDQFCLYLFDEALGVQQHEVAPGHPGVNSSEVVASAWHSANNLVHIPPHPPDEPGTDFSFLEKFNLRSENERVTCVWPIIHPNPGVRVSFV